MCDFVFSVGDQIRGGTKIRCYTGAYLRFWKQCFKKTYMFWIKNWKLNWNIENNVLPAKNNFVGKTE